MNALIHELRVTLRSLARTPGFTVVAILTLALGIGANSAIFSVINGVVLKPLDYREPERLMMITSQFPEIGFDRFWVSAPEYMEFRERNQSFADVGAYIVTAVNLGTVDAPMRVTAAGVTGTLFSTLGVPAQRGRTFSAEEDLPNGPPAVIIGHDLWQRAFAGDPAIIGRNIEVNSVQRAVVGVMPPGFDIADQKTELWIPLALNPANPGSRGGHYLYLIGRLENGVTVERAQADLESMLVRWTELNPGTHVPSVDNHRLQMASLQEDMIGSARTALWVLQAAVGFVLLIACANMANLLLARAESRHKEFAIRSALGAGTGRLLRGFVVEGVVLALLGGALGLLLALAGVKALLAANPESIPRSGNVGLDLPVLLFTFIIVVGTGAVFGLAPLLHLGQRGVSLALKEGGTRTTSTVARHRVRRGLVVAEVALAVMLVVGAGLMLRSFWNLMQVDSGFDRSRLVTFGLSLTGAAYPELPRRTEFFAGLTGRLATLPGVESVAAMSGLPPMRQVNANDTEFEGVPNVAGGPVHNVDYFQTITPGYLATMGIPVVEGRGLSPSDDAAATPVVLVNEALVKVFYPNESPIGRRIRTGSPTAPWFTIVGVVKDVKQGGLDSKTGTELYFNYAQRAAMLNSAPLSMNIVIRSRLPLVAIAPSIRQVVGEMDRTLPIVDLQTMDDVFADSVARPRFLMQLLGAFAMLALLLAAVGTYGILSYSVTERRREIGVRMALGADSGSVRRMVLGEGLRVTALGIIVGIAGSIGLTRLAASLLFGVEPTDPPTLLAVSLFITLVAFVACFIPARRATLVDPMEILRD